MHTITIPYPDKTREIKIANNLPFSIIIGPCAMESRAHTLECAKTLRDIFENLDMPFIFKSSFDKANRTSLDGYRGLEMQEGLDILQEVRETVGVPVLTDVHKEEQAKPVAAIVDMLQTPAFLCRQTDFIQEVASTNKPVNIKKGQFLAPQDMQQVAKKALATGNKNISLCERGATFGYQNLVVDFRSLAIMAQSGQPVIFDATHSVQLPSAAGGASSGQREFVPPLARAAIAVGVAGLFMESHNEPNKAPCDGANMIAFKDLPALIKDLQNIDKIIKNY